MQDNEIEDLHQNKNVRITKADLSLQKKVGTGEIPAEAIQKSQKFIDNNKIDFIPIATASLEQLATAIQYAKENTGEDPRILLDNLALPVMKMKSNAAMSGYPLITNLAKTMLEFLDNRKTIDKDIVSIVEAHYKSLRLIINTQMKSDYGSHGAEFQKELEAVCRRYLEKHKKTV